MAVGGGFYLWSLLLVIGGAMAADPVFPKLTDMEKVTYQTQVQVVDVKQQITGLATEYYDGNSQRVEVMALGERNSIFSYQDTKEILEVTSSTCQTWLADEAEEAYSPMFYGWLNKKPLRIGPAAALWYAENYTDIIKYNKQKMVRGILCDMFTLYIEADREAMLYEYYFAVPEWTPPYKDAGVRSPVRISVYGNSSLYSEKPDQYEMYDIITDFVYFKLSISDWVAFQPELGLGCPLRKPTLDMPKIPDSFRYSAEVFDILQGGRQADSDIEYQEVWYNGPMKMARLDSFTRAGYKAELYDFNTGVTYSSRNGDTCVIKPLRDSIFEDSAGKMMGHLKEPEEVLGLDGNFYYMGQRSIRGMNCDVFEYAQPNPTVNGVKLKRLVTTVYFSNEDMVVNTQGERQKKVPLFYMVTGWNKTSKVISRQYNVFGFNDITYPLIYSTFRLGRCFPSVNDKSYFVMGIEAKEELARIMKGQDSTVVGEIKNQIMKHTGVSDMRIPFVRADYKSTGVYITGQILERPPVLMQFWFELEWDATTHDPDVKAIPTAANKEQCAFACVDEDSFTCAGFFYCQNGCFLKSKDILEPDGEDPEKPVGTKCQEYIRSERNSNNKEPYLGEALLKLQDAVDKKKVVFKITIDEALKETKDVTVKEISIGSGPNQDNDDGPGPYNVVIDFAKLDTKDSTVEELGSVTTVNECYKKCKDSKSMDCASFSFCPDAKGSKQCRISSTMVISDDDQNKLAVQDKNCYIYIMKFLSYYIELPGIVSMLDHEASYEVKSAEQCAQKCRLETKFRCRGFEYCKGQKTCDLHSKHALNLHEGEIGTTDKSRCSHYAARYMADFMDGGHLLLEDVRGNRTDITLEECAQACSEERVLNCASFNYCPPSTPQSTDSSCAFSAGSTTDHSAKTRVDDRCRHYEKRENIENYGNPEQLPVKKSGYTTKGFTGLVVGMLFLGLALGVLGFVGYSYFRSRNSDSGMTVRFMKQET